MAASDPVVRIAPGQRVPADPTAGMVREQAIAVEGMWSGIARTEPRTASGWHHHGDHDTAVFVLAGALRMEFGPGGSGIIDAGPGDFVFVPRGAVHRESNPGDTPSEVIVVRAGSGPPTINLDGPSL
jgi:uncharacterized RmlC-like cupin family protein